MLMAANVACDRVLAAHGGGGALTNDLIRRRLLNQLGNPLLDPLTDGAVLPRADAQLVFTTDSYVVTPIQFPGGDIGRLAVAGTVNDLAVMGAEPIALSLGLILEEGLELDRLDAIIESIARTSLEAEVRIVTGDTKVIEHRGDAEPGLLINTSGIGRLRPDAHLGMNRIHAGDCVLINGSIAEHGLAILSVRNGLEFDTPLLSDVAPLNDLTRRLFDLGADIRFLRDATRGGVAGVLADIAEQTGLSVEIEERRVPLSPAARHAAELLGLDPLTVANEGKLICIVSSEHCARVVDAMRTHPLGRHCACMGVVTDRKPPLVELLTHIGGRRIVQRPYGDELPRIC